jgi:hypothetical protein
MPLSPKLVQAANGTGQCHAAQGTNQCKPVRLSHFSETNSLKRSRKPTIKPSFAAFLQEKNPMRFLTIALLVIFAPLSIADPWRTNPMTKVDEQYMKDSRTDLNDLSRIELGRRFGESLDNDLRLIQTLLDRNIVTSDQIRRLQAMGIIIGDHLRKENNLKWVIYIDRLGRSRALEVPFQDEAIFPVTQISSRAAVGADIDVKAIYQKLEEEIKRAKKKIIVR